MTRNDAPTRPRPAGPRAGVANPRRTRLVAVSRSSATPARAGA